MVVVGWQEGRSVHLGYESPWRQCCSSCWHVWEGRRTVIRGGGMWQGCNWDWDENSWLPWMTCPMSNVKCQMSNVQPEPWLSPRLAPGSSLTRRWTVPKRVDLFWFVGICWTYFYWLGFAELILIGWNVLNLFWLFGLCWTYSDYLGFVELIFIGLDCSTYFDWLGFAELLSRGVHIGFLQSTHLNSHHVSNGYSSTYDLDPENLECFSRWSINGHWW